MRHGTCKHFNGNMNECCDAGVKYSDVTPGPPEAAGSWIRRPCMSVAGNPHRGKVIANTGPQGTCEKREEPTDAEIREHEEYIEKRTQMIMKTLPLIGKIKKEHKGENWKGTEECPVCGGVLYLTHAACNGHVWGKCETNDCVGWME